VLARRHRAHAWCTRAAEADLGDDEGRAAFAQEGVIGQADVGVADIALVAAADLAAAATATLRTISPGVSVGNRKIEVRR